MEYTFTRRGSGYSRIIHSETDFEAIQKANGIFTKSHDIVDVVKKNGERLFLKKVCISGMWIFFDDKNIVKSRIEKDFKEKYGEH
jgi:hypothetical protein